MHNTKNTHDRVLVAPPCLVDCALDVAFAPRDGNQPDGASRWLRFLESSEYTLILRHVRNMCGLTESV